MQASVHRYDDRSGRAVLVSDEGRTLDVAADVVLRAGLRTLRIGQRLVVEVDAAGTVIAVAIPGMNAR